MAKIVILQRITHALGRVPVNAGSGLLFGRPSSISPQPMSLGDSLMAGYVKIWTTLLSNQGFLSLSASQRGLYLQLLIRCKEQRDDGVVCYRNVAALGSSCGCDRKTAGKSLGKIADKSLCTYTIEPSGVVTVSIPKYKKWQNLTAKEVVEKPRKNPTKIPPLRPDQTRPKQTRPDHLLSKTRLDRGTLPKLTGHAKAVEYWCSKYEQPPPVGFGMKYNFRGGKDGDAVKRLLATFGLEVFCQLVDRIFASDDPFYRTGGGVTLTVLSANANKLAQELARQDSFLDQLSEAGRATYLAGQEAIRARKQRRKDSPGSDSVQ